MVRGNRHFCQLKSARGPLLGRADFQFLINTHQSILDLVYIYVSMEKTVLVTAANSLSAASCGQSISFDLGLGKAKSAANTKLISKSLWTCCVEAIVEYCRVVFDLFPDQYQVCVHVYDYDEHT